MHTYSPEVEARLRADAQAIVSRYPAGHERSGLLPMLHLVQSEDGYITPAGIGLCADILGLTRAEVSAVATFYTQYKRHPNGDYTVGVCTNALCAVMGGDLLWEALTDELGIGHDETTEDGKITIERLECNAACDYAPVVMVNWEFFDNQTPESTRQIVRDIKEGKEIKPTRGPDKVHTFKEVSRVLAGFEDGHVDEGPAAGPATLLGLEIAAEKGWTKPAADTPASQPPEGEGEKAAAEGTKPVGEKGSSAERKPVTEEDKKGEEK